MKFAIIIIITIIASYSFKKSVKTVNNVLIFTISSSPRGEQSQWWCSYVLQQAAIKMISDGLYTPLWCYPTLSSLSLPLSSLSLSLSPLLSLPLSPSSSLLALSLSSLSLSLSPSPLSLSSSLSLSRSLSSLSPLSLSRSHTHTQALIKIADVLWCNPVSFSLSLSYTHVHTLTSHDTQNYAF